MTSKITAFCRTKINLLAMGAICCTLAFAERTGFDKLSNLVSMDLPEGFILEDSTPDKSTFLLKSTVAPVDAIVKIQSASQYPTPQSCLDDILGKLGFESSTENYSWRNCECTIASFNGTLQGVARSGYGACVKVSQEKSYITLLAYSNDTDFAMAGQFIASFLDSLYIDMGSYFETGLFTAYAFPTEGKKEIRLNISGIDITTSLDTIDRDAADFFIEKEYGVLTLYAHSPLWKEAWQRYYRMIFRDSFGRLKVPAFDIYNALAPECADYTELAQKLLAWTQEMSYEREKTNSDFSSLPAILEGSGSDCDSRAMMLAVLLQNMNQDAILFVSAQYSHALAGLVSDHPGFAFTVDTEEGKKEYLTGETTAKGLTWGKIAQNQTDQKNWIPILLP